jgi:hypothetical protein
MTFSRQYSCLWESKALSGAATIGGAGLLFACTALTRRHTVDAGAKQGASKLFLTNRFIAACAQITPRVAHFLINF